MDLKSGVNVEICDGCKRSANQCIPHGLPVNCCAYGCTAAETNQHGIGGHCHASSICRYFIEKLKEYDLLKEPKSDRKR